MDFIYHRVEVDLWPPNSMGLATLPKEWTGERAWAEDIHILYVRWNVCVCMCVCLFVYCTGQSVGRKRKKYGENKSKKIKRILTTKKVQHAHCVNSPSGWQRNLCKMKMTGDEANVQTGTWRRRGKVLVLWTKCSLSLSFSLFHWCSMTTRHKFFLPHTNGQVKFSTSRFTWWPWLW